jgi:hypothetical protein
VDHAIYTAKKLLYIIQNPLQTAIWEADPLTAFNTRDYWLSSYGWEDCFEGPNINPKLGFPTPYQAVCSALAQGGPCAPDCNQMSQSITEVPNTTPCSFESTTYQMSPAINPTQNPVVDISEQVKAACPADLLLAVKYGIVVALKRLEIGIIPTLPVINFILSSLGVVASINLIPEETCPVMVDDCNQMTGDPWVGPCDPTKILSNNAQQCVMVNDCNQMTGTENCGPYVAGMIITLSLLNGGTIPSGPGITEPLTCATSRNFGSESILASYNFPGITLTFPDVELGCSPTIVCGAGTIYPALMAAECLLLSILPPNINFTLVKEV